MDMAAVFEEIGELYPEALMADGFDAAFLGCTTGVGPTRLVYDRAKCIQILVDGGMEEEAADEFFSFNVEGAYVGEATPVFLELWLDRS